MNEELYNKLKEAGFYTKSFDEFQTKYGSAQGQQDLYSKLNSAGYYTKSFPEFQAKYFGSPQEERSFLGAIPVLGNIIHHGAKAAEAGWEQGKIADVINPYNQEGSISDEQLQQVAESNKKLQGYQPSEAFKKFSNANGFMESLGAFAEQPLTVLSELTMQSLAPQISHGGVRAGIGAVIGGVISTLTGEGPGPGAALGATAVAPDVSLNLEYSGKIIDSLNEMGVDVTDKDAIKTAFSDPELVSKIRQAAFQKGIPIAIFDGISAGIAGKYLHAANQAGKGIKRAVAKETALQMGLGGVGEVAGEISAGEKIQPGAILGEVLGEIGGGAPEIIAGAKAKQKPHPAQEVIDEHEKALADMSTGDEQFDKSLDDLSEISSKEVDELWEKAHEIAGTKTQEELQKTREENAKLKQEKQRLEQEQLGKILRNEIQSLPTLPHPGFKTEETTVPKYNPQTLEEEGTQPAHKFDFQLPHGSAQGTIVNGYASLDTIYANKDENGNPIKGKNLYGTLLDQLRLQGVHTLTVGNQTTASANALRKLVDKGELSINPKGDVTLGKNTIHTRFTVNPNTTITNETTTQRTPETPRSETNEGSQAPREAEISKTPELLETPTSKNEDLEITLKKRLENAKQRAPSRRIAAIEKVVKKAEEAGLTDFAKKAELESQKAFEEAQAKEEEKEELKRLKTAREVTKANKAAAKVIQEAMPKKEFKLDQKIKGTEVTLKTAKEAYLRDIAYLRESGKPEYKQRAEQYLKFRKSQGLKEITLEKALSESKAEHYIQRAQARITKESSRTHAINQRIKQMTKEGASSEEIAKVKGELENELKKEVQRSLGVDLNTLSGANLDRLLSNPEFIYNLRAITDEKNVVKSRLKHSSVEELASHLSKIPDARVQDLVKILKSVQAALAKEGKTLNLVQYNAPNKTSAGFYARGNKQDVLLYTLNPGNLHKETLNTTLHEIIHNFSDLLSRMPLQNDRSYSRDLGALYDHSKQYLSTAVESIINKEQKGQKLTEHELDLMATIFSNIEKFFGINKVKFLDKAILKGVNPKETTKAIINSLYGFNNKNEMASEGLASYKFAKLLNLIPYSGKLEYIKSDNPTILTSLFDKISKVITKLVNKYFPEKSSYNVFQDLMENYARQFEENPSLQKFNPYFYTPTLKDIEDQHPDWSKKQVIAERDRLAEKFKQQESAVGFSKKIQAGQFEEEIVGNIAKTLENRPEIKTAADVRDYIERVNKRLVANRQLGNVYIGAIHSKIQALRRRRQLTTTFVNKALDNARQSPKYNSSFKYKKDVDDFQSVDIKAVPQYKLSDLRQAVDALSRDMLISEEGYNIMVNYGKKLAKVRAMTKIAGKLDQHVALGGVLTTEQLSNPSTFSTILGRYDKKTSIEILRNIYGGMMEALAHVGTEAHKFTTELSKIADKNKLTHNNLSRIAMYGSIFSTKNDPRNRVEWEKEILDNAKFAVESAVNKKTAAEQSNYKGDLKKDGIAKEIEVAKQLHEQIKQAINAKKVDIMSGMLSKGETEFYNHFIKFAKAHEQDFFRNSFGAWGSDIEQRFNYFPTMAQGKVTGVLSNENDELIRNNKDNLFEALGLHDAKSDKSSVYSKKASSQYKRFNPNGYFYNYDAMNLAERWSKNMLYDLYATTELKALNRMFKDADFRKKINARTTDAFVKQIRSIAGVGNKYDSELPAFFKVIGNLYTATLATTGQIFNQSSSGFAAAAVISANGGLNAPKNFAKAVSAAFSSTFTSDTSKLNQFMKDNGLGIQVRDILFEKYLGSDDYKSYLSSSRSKLRNAIQNATEWSLRRGDKLGARVVWFAAYFNAGGTLERPNKDAILEAERQVGIMQNMSDMSFSAPLFKYDSMAKKILMGMFYAYKSFAVNAYVNLLYSAKNINNKGGREAMAAQLASVVAYHAIAASLVKPLIYDPILNAIGAGDDDDEEKKKYSLGQQIMAESLWDLGAFTPLFGMAAPGISDASFRWLFSETLAKKIYADESGIEAYDKYLDNPIYSMKNAEDMWKQAFGPGWKEMGEAFIQTMQYIKMQSEADEFFADMDKTDKADAALDALKWKIAATMYAASPYGLFGGDIKRITNARLRKEKARNLNNKPSGNTENVDFEGNEVEGNIPETVEKEYEVINE